MVRKRTMPPANPELFPWLILILALLLGAFVRLAPVLSVDFPLNDGGLFYAMVQDIRAGGYRLPVYASYNDVQIPFAYQPLAFYLAAGITDLTGWDLLDLFRVLPAVVSVLTIPVFYWLAGVMLRSRLQAGDDVCVNIWLAANVHRLYAFISNNDPCISRDYCNFGICISGY